jgi:hypothetical protein
MSDSEEERSSMADVSPAARKPYVPPSVRDYGDLVEMTGVVGGGFSDVPQGSPIGNGCGGPNAPSCFS